MENEEKAMYSLVNINNGVENESLSTTDFYLAQHEYQKQYHKDGVTPRVYVNGNKLRICEGDTLFGLVDVRAPVKPNAKPKYQNDSRKVAEKKMRGSHVRTRG